MPTEPKNLLSPVNWNPQVEVTLRSGLWVIGTALSMLGWMDRGDFDQITGAALQAIGPASMALAGVWSWWVNKKGNLVSTVENIDAVEKVKLDPSNPDSFRIDKKTGSKVTMTETMPTTTRRQPPERKFE